MESSPLLSSHNAGLRAGSFRYGHGSLPVFAYTDEQFTTLRETFDESLDSDALDVLKFGLWSCRETVDIFRFPWPQEMVVPTNYFKEFCTPYFARYIRDHMGLPFDGRADSWFCTYDDYYNLACYIGLGEIIPAKPPIMNAIGCAPKGDTPIKFLHERAPVLTDEDREFQHLCDNYTTLNLQQLDRLASLTKPRWRIIFDHSRPRGYSVNDLSSFIPPSQAPMPRIFDMLHYIAEQTSHDANNSERRLWAIDFADAYKSIALAFETLFLFAFDFGCLSGSCAACQAGRTNLHTCKTGKVLLTLRMGLGLDLAVDAFALITRPYVRYARIRLLTIEEIFDFYVDDGLGFSKSDSRAWYHFNTILNLIKRVFNVSDAKLKSPRTEAVLLGVLTNITTMEVSIPEDYVERFLDTLNWLSKADTITVGMSDRILGVMRWICTTLPNASIYSRRLVDLTRGLEGHAKIPITKDIITDFSQFEYITRCVAKPMLVRRRRSPCLFFASDASTSGLGAFLAIRINGQIQIYTYSRKIEISSEIIAITEARSLLDALTKWAHLLAHGSHYICVDNAVLYLALFHGYSK